MKTKEPAPKIQHTTRQLQATPPRTPSPLGATRTPPPQMTASTPRAATEGLTEQQRTDKVTEQSPEKIRSRVSGRKIMKPMRYRDTTD